MMIKKILNRIKYLISIYVWRKKLKSLGQGSKFFVGAIIHNPKYVEIGERSAIGDYVVIWGGGGVKIGNDVLIATHSVITSESHDANAKLFRETRLAKPVIIEDNVWLGAGTLVMPGVTIGCNTIIGAGSVVTKDISANSVAVGVPARVIKRRV